MRKIGFFIFVILILVSCKKEIKIDGYEINGTVKNIPDSTIIVLKANRKNIDSTLVIGEKFRLTGKVENPINAIIRVKNTPDYSFIWIENKEINFKAEKGKFIDRVITGSEIQKQADIHHLRIKPIKKEFDSLYNLSINRDLTQKHRDSLVRKYSLLVPKQIEISKKFVGEYPNFLESSKILNRYKRGWGYEISKKLFSKMNAEIKESNDGKEIQHYLSLPKNPAIGEQFIDFSLKNIEGKEIKVSDITAKYVLVEFWSSWCGPCRKSNPELVKEYEKYNTHGFEIIGVSLDKSKESWIKAIEKDSLIWTNLIDMKGFEGDVCLIYDINGIPDNFLMDQNGIIIERKLRGEKLKNKLKEIFAKTASL